jgi:DNA-binding transcriptional LysR family regulator
MVNPELRHLRSFVALAEELNFTRAAARLHIAQQALSAQVRQLESMLGVVLFHRTTRKVELTQAGSVLLTRAPAILADVEAAVDEVRETARGARGTLVIGLLGTAALDDTPRLLRALRERNATIDVSVRNVDFADPSGGVRDGSTDAAIVWLPFDTTGLDCQALRDDPRVAVLPADHPLAAADVVASADLAAEPFAWIEEMDTVARDFWTLADVRHGRQARIGATISGFDDLFATVRSGRAVAASPASVAATLPWPDIVTRPVSGLAPATLAICWRAYRPNPLVTLLVDTAVEVLAAGCNADEG